MLRPFVCSFSLAIAIAWLTAGYASANGSDFRFSPRAGTPDTTFTASFTAPFLATDYAKTPNSDEDYFLDAIGPPRCARIFEFVEAARVGQLVTMRLTARDDVVRPGGRRRWCVGRYVGRVSWVPYDERRDRRLIARFSFCVVARR